MSKRKPIISGNWKMHLNHFEAIQLVQKVSYELPKETYDQVEVSVHPPFTDVRSVQTVLDADEIPIALGAQNCHFEEQGAFTGEVSAGMLEKLNVRYVIVGHSERREIFGETDEMVRAKLDAVLRHGMTPIVCVGETLEERESGGTEAKVAPQVDEAVTGLSAEHAAKLVVAYEPIWAIGTGKTATPDDAQEVCALVRARLAAAHGDLAGQIRIQYGGSVKPANAAELLSQPDIDGALVGGASLEADSFARIVRAAVAT